MDDIDIDISNYGFAKFEHDCDPADCVLSGDKSSIRVLDVNPFEERRYYIRVQSAEIGDYTIKIDAASIVDADITDSHSVSITIGYPVYFPGLSDWAIYLLISLSVALFIVFGSRGINNINPRGSNRA